MGAPAQWKHRIKTKNGNSKIYILKKRVWYSGITTPFQGVDTGSSPVTRSKLICDFVLPNFMQSKATKKEKALFGLF